MKHTPGPWKVIPGSRDIVSCGDILKRRFVAEALESTIKSENQPSVFVATDLEVLANATLIASTPDLLEALKESLPWFSKLAADHDGDYIAGNVMRHHAKVSAVIAKAEGGENEQRNT